MFGEKAFELIKELDRNHDNIPPFNVSTDWKTPLLPLKITIFFFNFLLNLCLQDEIVRQVLNEMNAIFEQNHKDA